jgi:hypothetical protein
MNYSMQQCCRRCCLAAWSDDGDVGRSPRESLKACAPSLLLRGRSVALLASELGPRESISRGATHHCCRFASARRDFPSLDSTYRLSRLTDRFPRSCAASRKSNTKSPAAGLARRTIHRTFFRTSAIYRGLHLLKIDLEHPDFFDGNGVKFRCPDTRAGVIS